MLPYHRFGLGKYKLMGRTYLFKGSENGVHSGYVGSYPFQYWPPLPLPDGATYDSGLGQQYGFVEAAWRIYFICGGPTLLEQGAQPTTWGAIKSMYE